ncbi:MAG: hypothetical protein Ta2E_02560 [Mycoplasmoidaceae bacterium]|nr:MAG: hypothetical protein Ta2E_02560 [Mycoplasmoidaceae bacterium]
MEISLLNFHCLSKPSLISFTTSFIMLSIQSLILIIFICIMFIQSFIELFFIIGFYIIYNLFLTNYGKIFLIHLVFYYTKLIVTLPRYRPINVALISLEVVPAEKLPGIATSSQKLPGKREFTDSTAALNVASV